MGGVVRREAERLVGVGVVEVLQEGQEISSSMAALLDAGEPPVVRARAASPFQVLPLAEVTALIVDRRSAPEALDQLRDTGVTLIASK